MSFLYEWVPPYMRPRWWMARSHYSARRDRYLYVIAPAQIVTVLAWKVQSAWARHANAPSWIDREVAARLEKERNRPRW